MTDQQTEATRAAKEAMRQENADLKAELVALAEDNPVGAARLLKERGIAIARQNATIASLREALLSIDNCAICVGITPPEDYVEMLSTIHEIAANALAGEHPDSGTTPKVDDWGPDEKHRWVGSVKVYREITRRIAMTDIETTEEEGEDAHK